MASNKTRSSMQKENWYDRQRLREMKPVGQDKGSNGVGGFCYKRGCGQQGEQNARRAGMVSR